MKNHTDPLQAILLERKRQDEKWGEQDHGDLYWLGILAEELGEVAKAIIETQVGHPGDTRMELTQLAAVALAWLEAMNRRIETYALPAGEGVV